MAKNTQDREDLLRDGTQFVRRVELEVRQLSEAKVAPGNDPPPTIVFCGFRDNDAFSVYWGQDTVIQFNANGELRRAFWRDGKIASFKHALHWLNSEGDGRVRLARTAFTEDESREFKLLVERVLSDLMSALDDLAATESTRSTLRGQIPDEAVVPEVRAWLASRTTPIEFAMHPGVGKKSASP